LEGLNDAGRKAQDKIMQIPTRLEKVAEYLERKTEKKSFSFDLVYNRIFVME
jgi:acyl-[acyl-carrier-protein] desaturase